MKNKLKYIAVCIAAVLLMSASGNSAVMDSEGERIFITSAETEDENIDESASAVTSKLRESEETVDAEYEDITEFLQKVGSCGEIDIYYKDKDVDDDIWAKNGGKPAKKSDYTDEQKALADKIADIKKLGDFVAVDPVKKKAVAEFKDNSKCDEGKIYVSENQRYLLYINDKTNIPIRMRTLISSIDDPYLYRSDDGEVLEVMNADRSEIIAKYSKSVPRDINEEGFQVYRTADDKGFAWLSEDGSQVIGTFRECAENDSYIMLADDRSGNIGIKNKSTGYIWWSSPLGASRDKSATPLLISELRSSNILRYGIPEKSSNNNVLRSAADSVVTVSGIENGIRVNYRYDSAGFEYPVEYTLEEDHLKASLKISEIAENDPANIATEITLMGSFGAASEEEEGYFVIPDGCGALVRFNNGKTMDNNAYSRKVYGDDITAVPTVRGAVAEQIYLPVYGIVKNDNAMLVVASKGDSNADLSVRVSRQSNSSYNLCNFTFRLRGTDTFYMSGSSTDKFTVFESGGIDSDDIELRYYPITAENADYSDVAGCYRNYLINEKGVTPKTDTGKSSLYIDIYGGVQKKKPVLGVPVTMKTSVTSYEEAAEILAELRDNGGENMIVSYHNWTDNGIERKIDASSEPSGVLGGKRGFSKMKEFIDENGCELYPVSDNREFYSGNGYNSLNSTCVRISGSYARIVSYDRAYGIPDGFKDNMSLLSPSLFSEVFTEAADNFADNGLSGMAVSGLADSLYGDYGKKKISRFDAMKSAEECMGYIAETLENGMLADCANAYAIPYASHIVNVPLTSSRFDIFNEDVPFYQMVMHGLVPYSSTAVNAAANSSDMLLMSAVFGSQLRYDMLYAETDTLKDTEYDVYYYANHAEQAAAAAEEYKLLKPIYDDISDSFMTGCEIGNDGRLITASYSNGTVVSADLDEKTISYNGRLIRLERSGG